jgi:hypothetical protein
MASSYFTRPKGLHPTPSACFPPPPKGSGDPPISWIIKVFNGWPTTAIVTVELYVLNPAIQNGQTCNAVWTVPNGTENPLAPVTNGANDAHHFEPCHTAGFYDCKVVVTWPNGQVRTIPFSYNNAP